VTTASNPWEWNSRPCRPGMRADALGRRHARRMSRSFAGVGVAIPATRLRQISAGAAFAGDELTDIRFALTAIELEREDRRAKFKRGRRFGTRCVLFVAFVLVALGLLIGMGLVMLSALQHSSVF
jgi:hypothetical protein